MEIRGEKGAITNPHLASSYAKEGVSFKANPGEYGYWSGKFHQRTDVSPWQWTLPGQGTYWKEVLPNDPVFGPQQGAQ